MKPVLALIVFALISGALVSLTGCAGYQVGNQKPSIYSGISNIHVPSFKNRTLEPRLSSLVTNAVLKEIQADGTYQVTNRENCDVVLVGTIDDFNKSQLRAFRDNTLNSRELQIRLVCDFYLADPNTGKKITSFDVDQEEGMVELDSERDNEIGSILRGRVTGETIQVVDDSFQVGERGALAVAAIDLAEQLVSQLSDGW
ncbi:LPS assembly lipoprotein LptE [Verrucomicrobiales bacterium]|jgi:hypothetical protein|nr:LPS assembly lipoprotein LptE [Verrucomicrobiales bacterium]